MNASTYHRHQPFLASIRDRYTLSKHGSEKKTKHLVLDLRGSGITYEAGDSIGVFPKHEEELIAKTLHALGASGDELILVKQTEVLTPFAEFLRNMANLTVISPKLLREIFKRQSNPVKKKELEELQQEENREALKAYLEKHEVWDFLLAHSEVFLPPQDLADLLMPMLPRFYSISSSQKYVGEEAHITVAPFEYESNGHQRRGVCTHYLCQLAELHAPVVPVFIQPAHGFRLPEDPHIPIVMVGPGTGIAPFRAFLQERIYRNSKGRHWLFFGERNRNHDFFYEQDWIDFNKQGHLQLDLAFSRDQEDKIYVQHRMQEKGEELYHWLEEGAYLYVCGDAKRMAKDVEATLLEIIQEFGQKGNLEAKDYLKSLRQQKRYQRDVY